MRSINYCQWLLISVLPMITGCKKFVSIAPPKTQLVTASVFENNATASVAQTGIYNQMFSVSYNVSEANGLLSDELTNYGTQAINNVAEYMNQMTAIGGFGLWSAAYNYIYQENALLSEIRGNSALSSAVAKQLTGEALFVRAFWNFYLVNCYGDVPLVTTTDYTINQLISRSPRTVVFQQIIDDLQRAENLLNSNFVNADDTSSSAQTERVRPTRWAAAALLARAYLYTGNWAGADSAASAVIGNSAMFNLTGLDTVFLKDSRETIWALQTPTPASQNTEDGTGYVLTAAPDVSGGKTISPQLQSAFEPGDNRYTHWVGHITVNGSTYYFPFKYKGTQANFKGTVTEYTMVLRLAEQYLIRAEAEAQLNQLTNASADINTIRTRAGLRGTSAVSREDLLTAILHERQVELFVEWGHRWFDLIRMGAVDSVMGPPGNVTQFKLGTWVATDTLYPIPQSDRSIDPNLSQNSGY